MLLFHECIKYVSIFRIENRMQPPNNRIRMGLFRCKLVGLFVTRFLFWILKFFFSNQDYDFSVEKKINELVLTVILFCLNNRRHHYLMFT